MKIKALFIALALVSSSFAALAEQSGKRFKDHKLTTAQALQQMYEMAQTEGSSFERTIHDALVKKDVDGIMDLAYVFHGLNNTSIARPDLVSLLLQPYSDLPKVQALQEFLDSRSVLKAKAILQVADSPRSVAVAYMCLAEALYAKGDVAKSLMASVLSLAFDFTDEREEQAKLYLTGRWDSDISLKGTKEEVIARMLEKMKSAYHPAAFRRYNDMASVLGLLPEFPYSAKNLAKVPAKPLHSVIGFDANYAIHAGVSILSAMLSAEPSTRYVFHVPEDPEASSPVTEDQRQKLASLTEFFPNGKYKVVFENIDPSILPEQLAQKKSFAHWPRSILFKLYIPEIYSDYDRVMWLDSDLIVRSDLTPFFEQDLEGKWISGVRDCTAFKILPRLNLREEDAYVNAGVLLYDNEALRPKLHLIEKAIVDNQGNKDFIMFPEQDIMAVAFRGHIKEVSHQSSHGNKYFFETEKWNWHYHKTHSSEKWQNIHTHFAHIFHMFAGNKPWKFKYSGTKWSLIPRKLDGMENLYWALRDMGPWPHSRNEDKT